MAVTVKWVEWVSAETPSANPHDNFKGISKYTDARAIVTSTAHVITAATNINFGNTSARDLTPASYPIAAASNSYTKLFRLNFSGSFTQISNAKLWKSAGAYVTGETIAFSGGVDFSTPTATTYSTACTPVVASTNLIPTSSPAYNNVGLNAWGSYVLPAASHTLPHASDYNSSAGYYSGSRSSTMIFQLQTTGSTPAGAVNQKTISLTYDRQ